MLQCQNRLLSSVLTLLPIFLLYERMKPTIALSLTESEAVDLSGLIDIAVKAGGIKVAGVASGIHQKLFDACAPFRKDDAPLVDAEVVG